MLLDARSCTQKVAMCLPVMATHTPAPVDSSVLTLPVATFTLLFVAPTLQNFYKNIVVYRYLMPQLCTKAL